LRPHSNPLWSTDSSPEKIPFGPKLCHEQD
jgi:hypothetical protein